MGGGFGGPMGGRGGRGGGGGFRGGFQVCQIACLIADGRLMRSTLHITICRAAVASEVDSKVVVASRYDEEWR